MESSHGVDTLAELSLFSGYGGFTLGLRLARVPVRTVCYVEINPYRQGIIMARIRDGILDDAPIWDDIRTFNGTPWRGVVDMVTAGFPCQPHSLAGARGGGGDPRNLWPDTARVIGEVRPGWVLLENVPGILSNGYALQVVGELTELGYDCIWGIVSATDAGAPHRRKRWWVLAHAQSKRNIREPREVCGEERRPGQSLCGEPRSAGEVAHAKDNGQSWFRQTWTRRDGFANSSQDVANTNRQGLEERKEHQLLEQLTASKRGGWWEAEPNMGRVVDECPARLDRLAALGDGIVPAVVAEFLGRVWKTGGVGCQACLRK